MKVNVEETIEAPFTVDTPPPSFPLRAITIRVFDNGCEVLQTVGGHQMTTTRDGALQIEQYVAGGRIVSKLYAAGAWSDATSDVPTEAEVVALNKQYREYTEKQQALANASANQGNAVASGRELFGRAGSLLN